MKAIQQHIDYLFDDLPDTKEIKRIKNDLYLNATDRYEELISQGKTESEALGTIIMEIGDRDVLLESMSYNQEKDLKDYSTNTLEDARYYIASNSQEANKIGLGVLMILVGAGLVATASTFNLEILGVIVLLLLVALAVGLFINSGLVLEAVNQDLNSADNAFYMTEEDYRVVETHFRDFKTQERFRIPVGVMLCILAVIPILFFSFLDNELLIERYGVLLLTTAVGVGVFQFIKYGMIQSAYEKVLSIGEYSVEERQFQQKVEPIAGIYWTIITFIYLGWSFLTMAWHISWIIWPIAGAAWGVIAMVLKMKSDREKTYR